jgi:hypothetical protein
MGGGSSGLVCNILEHFGENEHKVGINTVSVLPALKDSTMENRCATYNAVLTSQHLIE